MARALPFFILLFSQSWMFAGGQPSDLAIGIAGHAFDHLGNIGEQADAAVSSGATVLYVTGVGSAGYGGLPEAEDIRRQQQTTKTYLRIAKKKGVKLALGYLCATSMVKLEAFDQKWSAEFRARFQSRPAEWRQKDRYGNPLRSWYGGDYEGACMNNPDWRAYEHYMVRAQLESGCDGIFFDNPTVHSEGCYCRYCMEGFARYLQQEKLGPSAGKSLVGRQTPDSLLSLRALAQEHRAAFMRFRCTIARNFLADMRRYARTLNPRALITANNSLNSDTVLYAQCRSYAYNIFEMSRAEDLVVIEDMSCQARTLPSGKSIEYGPTYKQLEAISHGKPVVAVTLAESDYHTAPHLVRLSMAEAVANGASHLWWPTWPEEQRQRMISMVRPEAEFLKENANLFSDTRPRCDVALFLPFRKWTETDKCQTSGLAAQLTKANLQYEVICEENFEKDLGRAFGRRQPLLLTASLSDLNASEKSFLNRKLNKGAIICADEADWMTRLRSAIRTPSITLEGAPRVRATIHDQSHRTIVHLLNIDIERLSSFEDRVHPAQNLRLKVRVAGGSVHSCRALTADVEGTSGLLEFTISKQGNDVFVETVLPRLEIAGILVMD